MVPCAAKTAAIGALAPWIRKLMARPAQDAGSSEEDNSEAEESHVRKAGDEKVLTWQEPGGEAVKFSTSLFPPFRGYAVYPRLALINHSCAPSCAVEFTF